MDYYYSWKVCLKSQIYWFSDSHLNDTERLSSTHSTNVCSFGEIYIRMVTKRFNLFLQEIMKEQLSD